MIRMVSTISLLSLLVLVLHLPAAYPPDRLIDPVRQEQRAIEQVAGKAVSLRILSRALAMADSARQASPMPPPPFAPAPQANAIAAAMDSVHHRLFDSAYFRSLDALLLLAAFRLSILLEWLPPLLVFSAAAALDGLIARQVKAKELRQHDPERFAAFASLAVLTTCATAIGFVAPFELPPMALPCTPLLCSVFASRAIGNFHAAR